MRPLELELVNFRSFDAAVVDWRPHELVVISGATGAGKTSLLDAICFALYGETPEVRRSAELLTLGRTHGEVRLTFSRGAEVWRVTRRYGRDAPDPQHLLERLAADGAAPVATIAGQAEVRARLDELVGMDFQAFTSAVILAQGRFAQFLQAAPRERDRILRELFGVAPLDAAREAAGRIAAEARGTADQCARERGRLPDGGPRARLAAAAAARAAAAAAARLAAAAPTAREALDAADEATARADRADALDAGVDALPDEGRRARIAADARAADAACDGARGAREAAERSAADARRALAGARGRHGGGGAELRALRGDLGRLATIEARAPEEERAIAAAGEDLARVEEELRARERLRERARLAQALAAARGAREAAERDDAERAGAVASAKAAAAAARGKAEARERALAHARRLHMAAAIRRELGPGDSCPVCGGTIGAGAHEEPPELEAAERALATAREEARRAGDDLAGARERAGIAARALARARADERQALAALREAGGGEDDDPAGLLERVGDLEGDRDEAAARRGALGERRATLGRELEEAERLRERLGRWAGAAADLEVAIAEVDAAERAAERAEGGVTEALRAEATASAAREALERERVSPVRQAAALLARLLDSPLPEAGLPAPAVLAEADRLVRAARREALAARRGAEEARARAARAEEALRRAVGDLGVASPGHLSATRERAGARLTEARQELTRLERAAARAGELVREERAHRALAERAERVKRDLDVNNFPRYLLDRYLRRLAAGASARLAELTGGAFRFAAAGRNPLAIVDRARGERERSPATLSGGERFLASLALALGLGDVAAESGGRLECLFLDEGFSTLDADSLEQALAGVEMLAGDGRLVGVITHLPGVAERLGASIRVVKDQAGVSRVVA